ncbi:sensor histidine kinase [Nonomuraea roseoviolacea]|uniref:histidine kinase n=1 Tax=Nonomuraea roseoviolacea subsp. carminata TaxID=160689 RepID=A0ABT1K088_9ACTN|nr:sensor histidine kinase [Nonomuraea roseoviolacea]MCP2347414.1 signal transduction histidine kinase [Nonomuraea roseoviolacea subsp. carminata]
MLRRLTGTAQVAALLGMTLVQVGILLFALPAMILTFTLGLVFLYPPAVRLVRGTAEETRSRVGAWSGVRIASPYLPEPAPPRPMTDGLYRYERTLYKSPRIPAWNARWKWLSTDPATWRDLLWLVLDPPVKLALLPVLLVTPARGLRVYGQWCALLLSATRTSVLRGQLTHLHQSRSIAADSQAAEMRRIERDLHDGTQARLIAIGMTLGAAEELVDSDPAAAKTLMSKARDTSAETLTELRRLIRGIHPPVLAERGLADAVRALAIDTALRVEVEVDLPHRPEPPVEAAAYFAVSELLANAARHGDARSASVDISSDGPSLRITVTDDGLGGADPAKGSGLRGIERRLAAFDGVMAVNSPPGGPTTVMMVLPKVLPEHWAGTLPTLPRWKAVVVALCWSLAWCPTFPQGVVAAVFKTFAIPEKSWFLALYAPEPFQWPIILLMIALGLGMYATAIAIPAKHNRDRWMAEVPRRLGLG